MWRRKSKRIASSQMHKREKKGKLPPFFAYFYLSMVFFSLCLFFFLHFEKRRKLLKRKNINKRVGAKAKNEKAEWKLEGKFLPFSTFFFFVFLFFLFFQEKKNMLGEGISESQK
jgi:lipopolysaccharide export LptBFGC system permease protein LptF